MIGRSTSKTLPHVRFFQFLERKPFAAGLCLIFVIILLCTLLSVSGGRSGSDTKVIFPVPGTVTKCPLHTEDAVKECHSELRHPEEILDVPGTYIIRLR